MTTKFEKEVNECVDEKMKKDSSLEKIFIPKKQREDKHKTDCVAEKLSKKKKG